MKKKALSLFLTLSMLLSLVPAFGTAASAAETTETVGSYTALLPDGITLPTGADSGTTVTPVTASDTDWGTAGTTSWYVATGTVTIDHTVTVKGDVHLILADGCALTVNVSTDDQAGICVSGTGNSLTIYAQSTGSAMGELTANGGACAAGIGGGYGADGENITINGGTVTATGGSLYYWGYCDGGAGIGGGYNGDGKSIKINGGTVIAQGGYYAAGVGGGYNPGGGSKGNGESITISGGTVTATGGKGDFGGGAGIGGGIDGIGSNISITGGTVTATCGSKNDDTFADGAAIGNGHTNREISASNITVSAGLTVKAGNDTPPTAVIAHTDAQDLASSFANKHYVTIVPPICVIDTNGNGAPDEGEIKYSSIAAALEATTANATAETDATNPVSTTITLIANDTENVTIPAGRNITLDLNGKVLKADLSDGKTHSVIVNAGTLTIKDSDTTVTRYFTDSKCEHGETIGETCTRDKSNCQKNNNTALADDCYETYTTTMPANMTGVLTAVGGCITGGIAEKGGGINNSGTLYLKGGNIVGNLVSKGSEYDGGGVYNSGKFEMSSGVIIGNASFYCGGGVYNEGTFKMTGGSITDNTAKTCGGGVDTYSTFTMSAGTISGNTTKNGIGAGVGVSYGSFTMEGGEISGNSALGEDGYGGGVCVQGAAFTMKDGEISGNTANYGGGVDNQGTVNLTGGSVTGNTATTGGGVLHWGADSCTLGGAVQITGNTASGNASNLVLMKDIALGTGEDVPTTGMNVGVTLLNDEMKPTSGAFTTNGSESDKQYFFSAAPQYAVAYNAGTGSGGYLELAVSDAYKWYYDNATATDFLIHNIDELEALAYIVNSGTCNFDNKTVKLADDFKNVKMDGTTAAVLTTPIGNGQEISSSSPVEYISFKGVFDGNNKTVELEISSESATVSSFAALFGRIEGGTVQNVSTSGRVYAKTTAQGEESYAAGIAGLATLSSSVINCYSSCTVKAEFGSNNFAGGVVGTLAGSSTIFNSYATGNITSQNGTGNYGGGVAANAVFSEILNDYATGIVSIKGNGLNYGGGLIGFATVSTVANSYATGAVSVEGSGTNNKGSLLGTFFGAPTDVVNCYCLAGTGLNLVGNNPSITNCYALPAFQMKAGTGEEEVIARGTSATWKDITVSGGTISAEKVSLVDALNDYVKADYEGTPHGYRYWGVMNERVNDEFPVFALDDPVVLKSDDLTNLPDGITYADGVYTFNNVNLASIGQKFLKIIDEDATIKLVGDNQLGVKADYTKNTEFSAVYGIRSDGNITITGAGSLTIYDYTAGIQANGDITFDENFTGKLTVYDYGKHNLVCCLTTDKTVTIKNGTFELNNCKTDGISAATVNISGGTVTANGGECGISAKYMTISGGTVTATGEYGLCTDGGETLKITGGTVTASGSVVGLVGPYVTISGGTVYAKGNNPYGAVCGSETLTIADTLEVTGANETYTAYTMNLTNKTGEEYVVIKAKRTQSFNDAPIITVPVSGDKDTVKVQATVSGGNAAIKNVTSEKIAKIGTGAEVVIDLTGLSESVTGVTIPKTTMENVAASEAEGLEIRLPNGTIAVFDRITLAAVASQAVGTNIQLVIDRDSKAEQTMTAAQKETVSEMNQPVVLDAYFTSNGKRISDFKGGEAEITATYPTTNPVRVWYVADDGVKKLIPGTYDGKVATFIVSHFSHYVVEMLDGSSCDTCPQDSSCVYAKFSDADPKAWYHSGVHFCVDYGYMNGVGNGLFAPNGTLSRGMIAVMLWRMEGSPVVSYAMSFRDVAPGAWYTEAIRWAQSAGVVLGYNESAFGPKDNVTREQLAAILWRYAKLKGYDVSVGEETNLLGYDDAGGVREYAIPAMQWACGAGIINGIGNRLEARGFATRAQAACMIQRFCVNAAK